MGSAAFYRTVWLLVLCLTSVFMAAPVLASDAHCGPRCVQRVLADYGQDVELIDLVREIQYPETGSPATLDKLQKSLESRGIYAVAIETGRFATVHWQHPMIVHVLTPTGEGHYVTRNTTDNPAGDESQFGRTGVFLLTSPDPIDQSTVRAATSGSKAFLAFGVLCLAIASAVGFVRWRSRQHVHSTIALVFVVCCALADNVSAQSADSDETAKLYEFVMAGIQSERESLVTGMFEAEEEFTPVEGPASHSQIFCAFDYASKKFRFDRIKTNPGDPTAAPQGGYYVTTPESVVYRQARNDVVAIRPADFQTAISDPFDFRVLGLALWPDMVRNTGFQEIYDIYTSPRLKPTQVIGEGETYRIIRIYQSACRKREIIIDGSKGFWPVRFSLSGRDSMESEEWHAPEMDNDLSVEQIGAAWVPSKFHMQDRGDMLDIVFHWKSVNEPIPAETFTYESFNLEGTRAVVDGRLGQPVVVKELGNAAAKTRVAPAQAIQTRSRTWVLMVLGFGALVLTGILIVVLRSNKLGSD
jgi:hypothetical protein